MDRGGGLVDRKRFILVLVLSLAVALFYEASPYARAEAPVALAGQVSSQEEGSMEGVLVSVKKVGSTITTTVVSDSKGRYSFPQPRREPGRYSVSIRAVGYDLDDPGAIEVTAR